MFSEENKVADELAKKGLKRRIYGNTIIFIVPPIFVVKQVEADTLGTIYTHKRNSNILISLLDWNVTHSN